MTSDWKLTDEELDQALTECNAPGRSTVRCVGYAYVRKLLAYLLDGCGEWRDVPEPGDCECYCIYGLDIREIMKEVGLE